VALLKEERMCRKSLVTHFPQDSLEVFAAGQERTWTEELESSKRLLLN